MKATIALCLWVTLCGLAVTFADNKNAREESHRFDVLGGLLETTRKVRYLMANNIETLLQTQMSLDYLQTAVREAFHTLLAKELNNTRVAVDAAKAAGKDSEYCLDDATQKLEATKQNTDQKIAQCINSSLQEFVSRFSVTTKLLDEGNALIKSVGGMYYSCVAEVYNRRNCIADGTEHAMIKVKAFEKKYKEYPILRKKVSKEVAEKSTACLCERINEGIKNITTTAYIRKSCVEGAE